MDCKDRINSEKCYSNKLTLIRPKLLSYVRSKVHDSHQAEDIVQDVLLILSKKANEFKPNKSFYNWAFKICHFQIRAFLTKSKRNKVFNFEDPELMSPDSLGYFHSKMPFQNLIQDEKVSIKKQIMSVLSKLEKQVFSLSMDGWSSTDIIYNLKINKNIYHTTKSRALKKAKALCANKHITNYKI